MALTTARQMARSAPGSASCTPPTADAYTSVLLVTMRARRSSTASSNASRPGSRPCDAAPRRRARVVGVGERLHLDQQRSLPVERGQHGRPGHAGAPIGQEQPAGVGHADETLLEHLEQAELVGGTEPVLDRAQQTQRVMPFALEGQHHVDHVLERAWPGQPAVLGDVARPAPSGCHGAWPRAPAGGAAAHLHDAAGRRVELGIGDGLDAVDDDQAGLQVVDGGDDVGQHRLAEQPQVGPDDAQPLGAQAHLRCALFGADVQGAVPLPRRQQLQQQRGLADARLAAEQDDRAGHDAVAHAPGRARRCRWGVGRRAAS